MEAFVMKQPNALGVLDHAPNGMLLIDLSGEIPYANEMGAKTLGKKPESVLGTTLWDYFPDEIAQERQQMGIEALKSGKPRKIEDQIDGNLY